MNQKKIVLQCACHFTRIGLATLINNVFASEKNAFIDNTLKHSESDINKPLPGDIVIVGLSHDDYNPVSLLNLICEEISRISPSSKILFLAEKRYIKMLQRYLGSFKNIWAFLDISLPIEQLQHQLFSASLFNVGIYEREQLTTTALTQRELTVLHRLLNGQPAIQVANDLNISEKTVSCHKRSALAKLDIRSLQPLLMNNSHRKTTYHRLYPSTNMASPQGGHSIAYPFSGGTVNDQRAP
ncbi:helix-turn-helix transcriptional regulator [Chania multitudinisentens]|uniref:helix-turn-helix transcriptional regulator n=1 Tax=Chania multitudinisentens TaxID=1639108 RepID=UPI0003E149FD|nr:LuxR C-terminal-related transcriptional regulator [Chania multitudinisentens]